MAKQIVKMTLNGQQIEQLVDSRTLLVHFLREQMNLTGAHIGCETSHCGACTVDIDGESVKACTHLAVQCDGSDVKTVEGLAEAGALHAVQEAFYEEHGLQCGFCTPWNVDAFLPLSSGKSQPHRRRDSLGFEWKFMQMHGIPKHREGSAISSH